MQNFLEGGIGDGGNGTNIGKNGKFRSSSWKATIEEEK